MAERFRSRSASAFDEIDWSGPPRVQGFAVAGVSAQMAVMRGINLPGTHVATATFHDHRLDALVFNRGGQGQVEVRADGRFVAHKAALRDMVAYIPNGLDSFWEMPHSTRATTVYLPRGTLDLLSGAGLPPLLSSRHPRLAWLGTLLEREMRAPGPGSALLIDSLLRAIALGLAALDHAPPPPAEAPRLDPRTVARVCDYLVARLGDAVTVAEVAAIAGMPATSFARAFRATTGQTLYRFVIERRIALARDLLAEQRLPVNQVAAACGFTSAAGFTTSFRRITGLSPRAYRAARA
ncbi:MAG: hypothetical protein A4S12_08585 [Proteobacteria bacterium SG_bin5]|nr:AraC family transcriptional regulator [Sphingomonas sp.]OQW41428.1 MAG: hypothetical protein A4S12_08585 [Proteobacteria bacterium SG_bin5]